MVRGPTDPDSLVAFQFTSLAFRLALSTTAASFTIVSNEKNKVVSHNAL